MTKHGLCRHLGAMILANAHNQISSPPRMLANAPAVASVPSYSFRSHHSRSGLPNRQPQQRPPTVAASMLPDDFDSMIIRRKSLSSLQQPRSHPVPADSTNADSSTSPASSRASMDMSDSDSASESLGGIKLEDIKAHKRAAVQQAFLNDKLGFGFSAGGLVFPYYVGLVSSLVQRGVLTRPNHLAGSSAGSLIAASFNAGLDMATVEESLIAFGEDCLKNGTRYRLGPLLRDFLDKYLPPDAHELCSGNTHVAVTRLLPYWRTQMVSEFHTREDLMSALLTSCHIPWYFDGRWMTKFRGHYCVDGGVMAFIPSVPTADYTVKVMCFPSSHLETLKATTRSSRRLKRLHDILDIDITMDTYEHWPYDLQQILKWALVASARETSSLLIEKGKKDAALWFEDMQLEPLVKQKQQQQQQQQPVDMAVDVGWGSGAGTASSGADSARDAGAAADWSDDKPSSKRQAEAARAQHTTSQVEELAVAAAAADGGGGSSSSSSKEVGLDDVAAVAGVEGNVIDHAEDALKVGEPLRKKRKVEAVAMSAAAAAAAANDAMQKAVTGDRGSDDSSSGNKA